MEITPQESSLQELIKEEQELAASQEPEDKFTRFKDADWFPKKDIHTIIGGAGGIGSWLSVLLSRAGFKIVVYDFDTLEAHNMAGQLFSDSQIKYSKVEALASMILYLCDESITSFNQKFDETGMVGKHMFSAFDNMEARKMMYKRWSETQGDKTDAVYIDGRLGMEHMEIFCVVGGSENVEKYKQFLFDDSQVLDAPCTMKQTSHSAAMIASHMVGFFTNHITNVNTGAEVREVPFFWQYYIPLNMVSDTPEV